MNSLQVLPRDLQAGKRYVIKSVLFNHGYRDIYIAVIKSIYAKSKDFLITLHDGAGSHTINACNFRFYEVPEEFYFRWNQRCCKEIKGIFVTMGMTGKYKNAAYMDLETGHTFSYEEHKNFTTIPEKEEIIEIEGVMYSRYDVIECLKELKPIK